jgi:large subunit ribosomal protein L24
MNRIRGGDEVIVIAGKDKGRRGRVLRVFSPEKQVLVENINVVKKHVRPNPNQGITGGIEEKEKPIHISNVMLLNPRTKRGDRVGFKVLENGKKVRFFKSDNEVVDV